MEMRAWLRGVLLALRAASGLLGGGAALAAEDDDLLGGSLLDESSGKPVAPKQPGDTAKPAAWWPH